MTMERDEKAMVSETLVEAMLAQQGGGDASSESAALCMTVLAGTLYTAAQIEKKRPGFVADCFAAWVDWAANIDNETTKPLVVGHAVNIVAWLMSQWPDDEKGYEDLVEDHSKALVHACQGLDLLLNEAVEIVDPDFIKNAKEAAASDHEPGYPHIGALPELH